MERVKLPRDVSDAIDQMKYMGLHNIIENVVNMHSYEVTTSQLAIIRDYFRSDWRLLAEALVNGYEVEQTPEDKVADYIIRLINVRNHEHTLPADVDRIHAEIRGATKALDFLNIKITGVNA